MTARRCQNCGALITTPRCRSCTRAADRTRAALRRTPRTQYAGAWRYNSQQLRHQHIAIHGLICPGLHLDGCPQTDRHPAADLVVDHDIGVICRSCNAIKANTYDRTRHTAHHNPTEDRPEGDE